MRLLAAQVDSDLQAEVIFLESFVGVVLCGHPSSSNGNYKKGLK